MIQNTFSHIDSEGNATMVDVGNKTIQNRIAKAEGYIALQAKTIAQIIEKAIKKGDVLTVAKIAGIQAAKKTADLIPLCHTLIYDKINVQLTLHDNGILAESEVRCQGRTGVEMEALTAVNIALLTIYDMCKAIDNKMVISNIHLVKKIKTDIK